jgi:hypothetical protein
MAKFAKEGCGVKEFDNKKNLAECIKEIRANLELAKDL